MSGPSVGREAFFILKDIHKTIMNYCGEGQRRCWEYMVEMIAQASGWPTDTDEARHVAEKMTDSDWAKFIEFVEAWTCEVEEAKRSRTAFSEPIGQLLEHLEGTNKYLDQYFTPMEVVRMMNEISLPGDGVPLGPNGLPSMRGLEPCCGTGRILIDALVHNDGLMMHAIDLDPWLIRVAKLNVRLLSRWTSARMTHDQALNPFSEEEAGDLIILGGRALFMQGDSLVVDTDYRPNWLCAPWAWTPLPWRENIKIKGFYGSLQQWEDAGRPELRHPGQAGDIQFDYSMKNDEKKQLG